MRRKKGAKTIISKVVAWALIFSMMLGVMPSGAALAAESFTDIDDAVVTTTGELFKIQYEDSSRWHSESGYPDLFFDGTDHYSDRGSNEDYYEMKFIGTGIQIYGSKNKAHANCDVYIDGEKVGEVLSEITGETVHKQLLFEKQGLENEEHVLKVVRKSGATKALQLDKIRVYHETLAVTKITLNAENVKLGIGGSKQLAVVASEPWMVEEPEIEWTSADETIAKVDKNGLVTAVYAGEESKETSITATVKGTKVSVSVKVVVDPSAESMMVTIGDEKILDTQEDYEKMSNAEFVESWEGTAWKGDTLNSKIVVLAKETDVHQLTVTASDFENADGDLLAAENISIKWLKEILAKEGRNMAGNLKAYPDIIHKGGATDVAAESLKFAWVSINVPEDTKAGVYTGTLTVNANELKKPVEFTYTIEVLDLVQPAVEATDIQIWQHPFSVANYYLGLGSAQPGGICNVLDEDFYFTEEHFNLMREATLDYVSMGGHDWVANIVEEAWNHQSYYNDPSMVKWTKKANGTWEFDYTWYDAWVEFGIECGVIDPENGLGQIKCYSIVPWNNQVTYYDEASGKTVKESHTPGAAAWTAIWTPFLEDFMAHSKEKGWFDITYISMDERTIEQLRPTVDLIESITDENGKSFKISSALNYAAPDYYDFTDRIHDISINLGHCSNRAQMNQLAEHRRELGLKTTMYTCTGNYPSNFALSDPGDNYWQIWYTMTLGMDGYLRWAWDNYVYDMHGNVTYRYWEPGDGWFIYPVERDEVGEDYEAGFYSTPRYELFKQGIRDVAKAKYLMEQSDVIAQEIDELVDTLAHPSVGTNNGSAAPGSNAQRFGLHQETDRVYDEVTAWAKAYIANAENPELPKDPNKKDPADDSKDYPVEKLTATTGSEQKGVESSGEGPVAFALDGNTETYYHSSWDPMSTEDQLWIVFELEEAEKIDALRYLPRPGRDNGTVLQYEVSYSMDGESWETISSGIWSLNKEWKLAEFEKAVEAKYIKFYAVDSVADSVGRHFSAAEIRLVKAAETGQEPTPEPKQIRIACVGDSLTEGYKSSGGNKSATAYPAYLQQMLGDDYKVENFGKSSMTLMKNNDRSYWKTTEFRNSLAFDPDIVIIMLGTNDCKSWDEAAFRADAVSLVNEYKALESKPQVIFAVSPHVYLESGADITMAKMDKVIPVQRALVEENGWDSIDMYEKTEGKENLYNADLIHFTDSGYYYLAQCMYEAITGEAVKDASDDSRDLPLEAMKATALDSQTGEGPERVLDNDSTTLWHTDWYGTSTENHWIQLEIEEGYCVDGLRYEPRQEGKNGIIAEYEIQVSNDGTDWETVAAGNWNVDSLWKMVSFEPMEVKFVRLVSKNAHTGNPGYVFASAAEIRLTGAEVSVTPEPTPEPTPEVTPTPEPEDVSDVFPDVKHGAWYEAGVQFVYDNGLMSGSNGLFNPTADITRAQIVTTLYRLAGEPEVTDTKALTDFTDVAEGKYYSDAVCWAYANGIATGNDGKFDPTGKLTRQQMAAFFF